MFLYWNLGACILTRNSLIFVQNLWYFSALIPLWFSPFIDKIVIFSAHSSFSMNSRNVLLTSILTNTKISNDNRPSVLKSEQPLPWLIYAQFTLISNKKTHTSSTNRYGIMTTRGRGSRGWPERCRNGQVVGGKYHVAQLPGRGGAFDACLLSKIHPTKTPTQHNANNRRRTQGGRGRDVEMQRDPQRSNPQGTTGTWVQADGGKGGIKSARDRQQAQGSGTSDRGWRVEVVTGDVQVGRALHKERRLVAGVN